MLADFDLARPLSPADKDAIIAALLAHHVVIFPDQALTREEQFAFAANFGEVEAHGAHRGERKRHGVAHILSNLDEQGRPTLKLSRAANYHWHTDKPYHTAPPMLTMLHAVELPPAGGDTEFADTALAYEELPEEMKRRIAPLRVVFRPAFDGTRPPGRSSARTHAPETACERCTSGTTPRYLGHGGGGGRGAAAGAPRHATQPRYVYTHRWRLGDLVMWDNRCLCTAPSPISRRTNTGASCTAASSAAPVPF